MQNKKFKLLWKKSSRTGQISRFKSKEKKFLTPLIVVSVVLVVIVAFVFYAKNIINTPNSKIADQKVFVISLGQGASEIAERLKDNQLIKNRFVFILYLNYKGLGDRIQAGEYKIAQNLKMIEVASIVTTGKIVTSKITIPEGWTNAKIGDYLGKNTAITKDSFIARAAYIPSRDKYDFLESLDSGESLEGFLYPDTYQISLEPTADEVIKKMLDNFDKKLTQNDRDQIKKSGMSLNEVITLASVVEREVSKPEDRKLVASVFLNRLNNDIPLESCATIQYILNSNKTIFSYEETRTPSAYNTYINPGLPKGPIGNPSIDSIRAVLFPEKSNYFYFLSSKGTTYFSRTLDEHNNKKNLYLR